MGGKQAMSSLAEPLCTAEEYLTLERAADRRSELVNGRIYAMAGAGRAHGLIIGNLMRHLGNQLLERPCEMHTGEMRVKVSETGTYVYPDVVVACGEPDFEDGHLDTLTNPTLVVEVLSPSTEGYDRSAKFAHYRRVPSLRQYVLIAQSEPRVECYTRQEDGELWLFSEVTDLSATVHLASIECDLPLTEAYRRVTFPPPDEEPQARSPRRRR